jgi:DNA-binding MarR family transcriptional regulator
MAKASIPAEATLDRSPSHLLHRALQLALDIYGEETGPGAVTQRQYAVMTAVGARDGCTQSDLVRATGIDRSTLAELVARLIGKGLLARERSNFDARANTVTLTAAGRDALDTASPRVAAADERILGLMPSGRRDQFLKTLRDIARGPRPAKADKPPKDKLAKAERKKAKAEKKARKKAATGAEA